MSGRRVGSQTDKRSGGRTLTKKRVVGAIQAQVRADLEALTESQKRAVEAVTHEECRQENDKDTRAIEAWYLARGLARRVVSLRQVHEALQHPVFEQPFAADEAVRVGALVTLTDDEGQETVCLIAGSGGGLSTDVDGVTVRLVTPDSPLGKALLGQREDDEVELQTPGGRRTLVVVSAV